MKTIKIFAIAAAVMMLAVAGIAIIDNSESSDALNQPTGAYNVYYYDGDAVSGYEWKVQPAATYDLFQAIDEAKTNLGFTMTADSSMTWGTGWDINPSITYGTIYTINNSSDFTVFVYDNRDNQIAHWDIAQSALGWYRCFEDYASSVTFPTAAYTSGATAGAANVAIVPFICNTMPNATKAGVDPQPTDMQALTAVDRNSSAYEYTFHIADSMEMAIVAAGTEMTYWDENTSSWVTEDDEEILEPLLAASVYFDDERGRIVADGGIKVRGYGSDVYQAFCDAIGLANIYVQLITWMYHDQDTVDTSDDYYTYYSWYDLIFGQGTDGPYYGTDGTGNYSMYIYWEAYTENDGYLSFCPGYYSKLNGALQQATTGYDYTYLESIYYY